MDAFEQVKNSGKSVKTFTNADAVINSNDKGLQMMSFVHDLQVYHNVEKSLLYLRACCWASYKRNVKYKVKLVLNQKGTPKIVAAKCDRQCPASNSECCCQVLAVIWKIEDMTRRSELTNSSVDSLPCTSKPKQWGKGHKREVEFHPVMACNIVKPRHASDLPGRKRRGVQSQFYGPRPEKFQKLDVDGMLKLKNDLQSINPKIPFAAMLPERRSISTVKTIVGTVAHGSIIHKQLQQFTSVTSYSTSSPSSAQRTLTPICNCPPAPTTQGQEQAQSNDEISDPSSLVQGESHMADISDLQISPTDGEPVSQDCSQVQERLQSTDNLPLTQVQQQSIQFETFIETLTDVQKQIENATRGQSVNPVWFEQKQNRITASICKDVYSHMNSQRSKIPESLIKK